MANSQSGTAKRRTVLAAIAATAVTAVVGGATQTNWYGLGPDDPAQPAPSKSSDSSPKPADLAPAPGGPFFQPDGGVPRFLTHFHALDDFYWPNGKEPAEWLERQLEGLQKLGVEGIRVDLGWSAVAPKPPGELKWDTFHLARLLKVQNMLRNRGMSMILVPQRSPEWARPGTKPDNPNQFPTNMAAVTDFARQLVSKLDPQVVKAIEAWNEPNLGDFTGIPKEERPQRYAEFLTAFHGGVQLGINERANRGEKVEFPVLFAGVSRNDTVFLDAALKLRPPCEAIGAHPYMADQSLPVRSEVDPKIAEQHTRSYPLMREVATRHGYGQLPHGFTEFGVSVHDNDPGTERQFRGATAGVAAQSLSDAYDLAQGTGASVAVYYVAHRPPSKSDTPGAKARHRGGMNLLEKDGTPLPHARQVSDRVQQRRREALAAAQSQTPRRTATNMPTPTMTRGSTAPTR